jgi:hypothetical protein
LLAWLPRATQGQALETLSAEGGAMNDLEIHHVEPGEYPVIISE